MRENDERATTSAAAWTSASASTTTGFLPPSSSCSRWPRREAAWILRPTAVEPVNVTASTLVSATRWAPASKPWTTLRTPGGRPASTKASARRAPINGVIGDGLNTTAFPAASAGPILRLARFSGKFHGVITATTPTGIEHGVHERRVVARVRGAEQPVGLAGVQLEVLRCAARLVTGVGEWLAFFGDHLRRQLVGSRGEQARRRRQHVGTGRRRRSSPRLERVDGSRHRIGDVGGRRLRRNRDDLTGVRWVAPFERRTVGGADSFPTDEVLDLGAI